MPLLLAIEPDPRQASLIAALAQDSLRVDLVVATSAGEALTALGDRVPDLILTSQLLSTRDESLLTDRLRELDAAGMQVQTLVIPVLADADASSEPQQPNGLLARLGWRRPKASGPDGCDPAVFAGQISEYLKRAVTDRVFVRLPESSVPIEHATAKVEAHLPESTVSVENLTASAFAHLPESSVPIEDLTPDAFAHLPASSFPAEDPKSALWDEEPIREIAQELNTASILAAQPPEPPLEGLSLDDDLERYSTEESANVFEDAVRAELAAMFAAVPLRAPVEQNIDDSPFALLSQSVVVPPAAPASIVTLGPAAELPRSEPWPVPPAFRSDLLEMLAAIQRDLEPLRIDKSKTARKASTVVQDEWGFFDPKQCGIAALFVRLEQIAESRNATL